MSRLVLKNISIDQLEVLAPRVVFGLSQLPLDVYDYRMSEILAGNGPENLAVRRDVTTVRTPGVQLQRYEDQGGLFFGRGTFHDAGIQSDEFRLCPARPKRWFRSTS